MLQYIELKSGFGVSGPAWISRVSFSKTKSTVYFNGQSLKRAKGGGISGNYYDMKTGEEYWVSGVKKNGGDRHWAGSGIVLVDEDALKEYLMLRNWKQLDIRQYKVTRDIIPTDIQKMSEIENSSNWSFA